MAAMLRVMLADAPVASVGAMPTRSQVSANARAGSRQHARHNPTPVKNSAPVSGSNTGRPGIVYARKSSPCPGMKNAASPPQARFRMTGEIAAFQRLQRRVKHCQSLFRAGMLLQPDKHRRRKEQPDRDSHQRGEPDAAKGPPGAQTRDRSEMQARRPTSRGRGGTCTALRR